MDYVVTLTNGNSFVVPDTAVPTQQAVHGAHIATILPEGMPKPQPVVMTADLPSAMPVDFSKMGMKELREYCIEKQIPPSEWNGIKNVMQLRKKLKNYNG